MQTKYNIGQFVEVRAFDCSYGTHICRFEIKSITILKNNIMYNMEDNGTGIGFCEEDIVRVLEFKDQGENI